MECALHRRLRKQWRDDHSVQCSLADLGVGIEVRGCVVGHWRWIEREFRFVRAGSLIQPYSAKTLSGAVAFSNIIVRDAKAA